MAISETFGRADSPTNALDIPGYNCWNTERTGRSKKGGGLTMYYRDSFIAHKWEPQVPASQEYVMNERQWLLLDNKIAFLHVYIACQNFTNDGYLQWNEDLFRLLTEEASLLRHQGFCCLAMGDFNTRVGRLPGLEWNDAVQNINYPQFINFISQVNLTIINTLPLAKGTFTRFMDSDKQHGSSSLLDYGLINNEHVHTVSSFVIDEEARYECGSDHALLECTLKLDRRPSVKWNYSQAISYNITGKTDYNTFREILDKDIRSVSLDTFSSMTVGEMLHHVTETMHTVARDTIGTYLENVICH